MVEQSKKEVLVTTYEVANTDQIAKEAAEKIEKKKELDWHLSLLWKGTAFDFEASIKFMELCVYFDCLEAADGIKRDLRKSNPYSWAAYVESHRGDYSSADGKDV